MGRGSGIVKDSKGIGPLLRELCAKRGLNLRLRLEERAWNRKISEALGLFVETGYPGRLTGGER